MTASEAPSYEEATSEVHRPGHEPTWEEIGNGFLCTLCGHIDQQKREWAVRNPASGIVMTVPNDSLVNALKMVALVPDSAVMTRLVGPWTETT